MHAKKPKSKSRSTRQERIDLPPPTEVAGGGLIQKAGGKATLFLFPETLEYAEALNPLNWGERMHLMGGRTTGVSSTFHGKPIELILKQPRRADDPNVISVDDPHPITDARANIKKAMFVHKHLTYEDDNLVVKAEKPLGVVRLPGGLEYEVYLSEDAVKKDKLDDRLQARVDEAIRKYGKIKKNLGGFMFEDSDELARIERNLLFKTDERGRIVLIKIDTEYTRVTDLSNLLARSKAVDRMLESVGFKPKEYDKVSGFKSLVGHPVAERLLDACAHLDRRQEKEFLSPENAGLFVKSLSEYAGKKAAVEGYSDAEKIRDDFMMTLSVILGESMSVVASQRTEHLSRITVTLRESEGVERKFRAGLRGITEKFEKIKPDVEDKKGVL